MLGSHYRNFLHDFSCMLIFSSARTNMNFANTYACSCMLKFVHSPTCHTEMNSIRQLYASLFHARNCNSVNPAL